MANAPQTAVSCGQCGHEWMAGDDAARCPECGHSDLRTVNQSTPSDEIACSRCGGRGGHGGVHGDWHDCPVCRGDGAVPVQQPTGPWRAAQWDGARRFCVQRRNAAWWFEVETLTVSNGRVWTFGSLGAAARKAEEMNREPANAE